MNAEFQGYRRDAKIDGLPHESGVYIVYRGVYSPPDTCTLKEIIYIGKADDINDRLRNHDRRPDFEKELRPGETLYYAYAVVTQDENKKALENALICSQKPRLNIDLRDNYVHEISDFNISGACALVDPHPWSVKEPFTIQLQKASK